jgi:Na+/melibiose symporter-like transporter
MEPQTLPVITSAVAPIVMVSAAGLLFMGLQSKNLHLADRIRALTAEYRASPATPAELERRQQIVDQLRLFQRRIRLSQRALELIYLSIVCFVTTSLLLPAVTWLGGRVQTLAVAGLFVLGVALLLTALIVEFLEMRVGLKTIGIEIDYALRATGNRPPG